MQQHQRHQDHPCIEKQRPHHLDIRLKNKSDDFFAKLERIRLSAAATSSKPYTQRSAAQLLDESKRFFVKSQEVLQKRQSLINPPKANDEKVIPAVFRMPHPRRSPYQEYQLTSDHLPIESLDLQLNSSRTSTSQSCADLSDSGLFESVSLLSLSDQTTLESDHSPSPIDRTVIPSTNLSVIERNARIIKWLFQLNKANATPSFQTVQ